MTEQLQQHKRFTKLMFTGVLSQRTCYWYVHTQKNIVAIDNADNSKHQRPDNIHT